MKRRAAVDLHPFADFIQHLMAELERIDVLIRAQVQRARQLHAGDEAFGGLYISEQEVEVDDRFV